MFRPIDLYHRLPVWAQHLMCSIAGAQIQYARYTGSFWRYLDQVKAFERLSPSDMELELDRRLRSVLIYAHDQVPYYRDTWGEVDWSRPAREILRQLPYTTKQSIKREPFRFVSDMFEADTLVPYPTGGTSGSPLVLRFTNEQIRHNFAFAEARIRNWHGVTYRDRQATFLGKKVVPTTQQREPFWRSNLAGNQKLFSTFHLSPQSSISYIKELDRYTPDVIVGYVTPIYLLSKYLHRRKRHLQCKRHGRTAQTTMLVLKRKWPAFRPAIP